MIDINGLVKKINMMPNSKEKALKLSFFYSYISFLIESRQVNKEDAISLVKEINESEVFLKHLVNEERNQVNNLLLATPKLTSLYKNVLNHANKYNLFSVSLPNINIQKLASYAEDFLKFIDNDLYKLYDYLINDSLIYESDINDYGGKCFKLEDKKSAIIIKYDTIPFYKIFALVHEMGHAYYHYLGRGNPNLIRSNLGNECMPRILEQLFLLYLRENHLMNQETLDYYERFFLMHQIDITNSTYIVNKLLLENKIPSEFYVEMIKPNLTFEEYYNLSIIKSFNEHYEDFLSFNNNYYAYAFLLSMIMRERFIKDEKETKEFMKDLPYYARNLSTIELINLFDKTEYLNSTNRNISRILTKTNYKNKN